MGRPAQAGTGSAGELTPCTTAAAPACQARGGGGDPGEQGQAGSKKLGRRPREGQGTAWVSVITTTFCATGPQLAGLLLGPPVGPRSRLQPQGLVGSALLEMFF